MERLTSVAIVNFNAGPLLSDCVRSVLASSDAVEVFVIDNASQDDSLRLLRDAVQGDPRLRIVLNRENRGFARANNQAMALARGDYLLLLNPDCVIEPSTLARMRQAMDARPHAGLGGCLILNTDGTEQAGCRRAVPTPWRAFVRAFGLARLFPYHQKLFNDYVLKYQPLPTVPIEIEAISGAFMFARRSALDTVGLLDEGYFMHCEDLDWCMRFRQGGFGVLFVPEVRIVHVKGVCGRDRPIRVLYYMHRGMVRFYEKFFRHQYPSLLMWAVALGVWLRFSVLAGLTLLRGARHHSR